MRYPVEDLNKMSVDNLRKLAVKEQIGTPKWRAFTKRDDLVAVLSMDDDVRGPVAAEYVELWEAGIRQKHEDAAVKALTVHPDDPLAKMLAAQIQSYLQFPEQRLDATEALVRSWEEKLGIIGEKLDDRVEVECQQMAASMAEVLAGVGAKVEAKLVELENRAPTRVEIVVKQGDDERTVEGLAHSHLELLLRMVGAECHVFMCGPAGSGKTKAAEQVALALDLPFYPQSVGAQTTMSHLLGFIDATGNLHKTPFRRAYEDGGVFILDEIDAGNANVITALNAGLANGYCSFPDGIVARHQQFRCIAAGNTLGTGADRMYVGRNQLDAATLDRFCYMEWPYDVALEGALVGLTVMGKPLDIKAGGLVKSVSDWFETVRVTREVVDELKIRHIVSPRATIFGARLAEAGIGLKHIENAVLWKGCGHDSVKRIQEAVKSRIQGS